MICELWSGMQDIVACFREYPSISLEELRKATKNLSHDVLTSYWEMNLVPSDYEAQF